MADCTHIDPLVTPYVDDTLGAAEREAVDRHLSACPPCRERVHAEHAIHTLIQARRSALSGTPAPPALRTRCAFAVTGKSRLAPAGASWRTRLVPIALAASLVLLVVGAFVYELTARSAVLMAAELTADHLKCFRVINNVVGAQRDPALIESSMATRFDWPMRLPDHAERAGLELVGARPCLYGEGLAAHLMYKHQGHPVSIFMLPGTTRVEEHIEVLGHHAAIWSIGDRTFVLISSEPPNEVARMTSFIHGAMR
jgi:anti-sigma factor RsiW